MGSSLFADRYRLEEVLSTTVMADVRTATDVTLDRRVVVKLLAPEADRSRFEREAQAAAALAHPNIVQVFDYGEAEDRPYIVFEYLPGGSLEARLVPERPLPDDETARIAHATSRPGSPTPTGAVSFIGTSSPATCSSTSKNEPRSRISESPSSRVQ